MNVSCRARKPVTRAGADLRAARASLDELVVFSPPGLQLSAGGGGFSANCSLRFSTVLSSIAWRITLEGL